MEDAPVLQHCSLLRNPDQNRPVCWSITVKEKPTDGSQFFGAFPSDRTPKATKDINAQSFIYSFTKTSLMQQFLYIIPANSGKFLKLLYMEV
jgi:hypothetical protein